MDNGLKKELNLIDLIFFGLGCIVGAGVFVILGRSIIFGGKYTLYGFLGVAVLSFLMGFVYIELHSRYKSGITEYLSVKDTMGEKIGIITQYIVYLFAIFTSMTIIVCITKYIGLFKKHYLLEVSFSILIVGIMTIINLAGIKTSKIVSNTIGGSMFITFLIISLLGLTKVNFSKIIKGPKVPWNSFILSAILALFLFNGYDVLIKMSAEAKEEKNTKKAVIWSLGITTFFYTAIILSLISVLGYKAIGITYHPLTQISKIMINRGFEHWVYLIGIVILFNTAFLTLIGSTRFLYGLAEKNQIPFSQHLITLNNNQVPKNAIMLTFILCVLCALLNNEVILTVMTNFSVMYILIVISIALLVIRWRKRDDIEDQKEHNHIRGNIKNIPIPVVISLAVMFYLMIVIIKNKFWIGDPRID